MSNVFVLDRQKQPLTPVHPGRARLLLSRGKAAVYRRFPFTIILKVSVEEPNVDPLRLKLDPGASTTGIAIVNQASGEVVFAAHLKHRGFAITASLTVVGRCAVQGDSGIPAIVNRASIIGVPTRRAGFLPACTAG